MRVQNKIVLINYKSIAASIVFAGCLGIALLGEKPTTTPVVVAAEVPVEEVETVTRWTLPGGSNAELLILDALQDRGITDRNALATIMGNIKQESRKVQ